MRKFELTVPFGIKYISEWKEYSMPKGHCIVDKGVTGCGYTEMCLRNNLNIILCSPRKLLLENKEEKHRQKEQNLNVLYLRNNISELGDVQKFQEEISKHLEYCSWNNLPIKFMITYDSSHYLIDYLSQVGLLDKFFLVADEFQSIFLDAFFKAEVENSFVEVLQCCPNVIYLSATPMLEKYLMQIDAFKDLDYYSIDWTKSGYIETLKLNRKRTNCLGTEADKVIQKYLCNDFPISVDSNGNITQSKEAVLFFNSVNSIVKIIKKNKLLPEQCNIICADDEYNKNKIRKKLGKAFSIGKVPLEGEENKMFTFCTSTTYIGADFHSKCASTFVFSDPNLQCLALDISLDLPQIAGRQRDRDNPFKNNITIFYKTTRGENLESREQFDEIQQKRREQSIDILRINDSISEKERETYRGQIIDLIAANKYSKDFISVSKNTGLPTYNKLIEISYERAWEVSQKDYQDTISVTKALDSLVNTVCDDYIDEDIAIVNSFLDTFYSTGVFSEKLRMYCEFMDKYKNNPYINESISCKILDMKFKNYYNFFGTAGCRAGGFRDFNLGPIMADGLKVDRLSEAILKEFAPGNKLSNKQIKEMLKSIYGKLGISKTPKATDLEEYFEVKAGKFYNDVDNKWLHGLELLSYKKKII